MSDQQQNELSRTSTLPDLPEEKLNNKHGKGGTSRAVVAWRKVRALF